MNDCPFCQLELDKEAILVSKYNICIEHPDKILQGSVMIIPKIHRETVFDLFEEEFLDTYRLLNVIKKRIDEKLNPDGYNVGWNCYPVGGQTVPHVHLHIIPRFKDEPLAFKGIRHHLKQKNNMRESLKKK